MDVFEAAAVANGPDPTRRHRIEHLESVTKESIARMAAAGVIASLQPVHADPVLAFNWMAMLGHDDRCNRAFPWTEFVDAGVDIALGTDAPTAPYDALPNMYIASTRRSALKPDMPWPPTGPAAKHIVDNQRFKLPMAKAIVGATRGAAFSCRAENMTGSLQPGMAADFCILSVDPFKDGTATLAKAQEGVKETWVAGKQLYVRKS
jgi:predicted amidohydrolase YtcJ